MAKKSDKTAGKKKAGTEKKKDPVKSVLDGIRKKHGQSSIFTLTGSSVIEVPSFSTGYSMVDYATGIGGFPEGRITELFGPPSSGKTTIALTLCGRAQKRDKKLQVGYIDAEHALDPLWARKLGVDLDRFHLAQPDYGEQGLEIADALIASGQFKIIIVDSVAALVPKAEIEGDYDDKHIGLQARMMGTAMRKLTALCKRVGTLMIFINQERDTIGGFGNKTTPGGNALKFFASMRVRVTKDKQKGNEVGYIRSKATIVKNKMAPPFKLGYFWMGIDGYSRIRDIFLAALETGVGIEQKGAWFSFNGVQLGQGLEKTLQHVYNDFSVADKKALGKVVNAALEKRYTEDMGA